MVGDTHTLAAELKGHDGPVWQVAWAHPKFGTLLASASYDGRVIVWRENGSSWTQLFVYKAHTSSVNSLAFAPHEYGLMLACASSDNDVSVLTHKSDDSWEPKRFFGHQIGGNAVSWCPAAAPSATIVSAANAPSAPAPQRFASGGCDNAVKIWAYSSDAGSWSEEACLTGHTDWVRDVAFAPNLGLSSTTLASCSQDGTVIIWTQSEPGGSWKSTPLKAFGKEVVWRVSWSLSGGILAVSTGDNKVTLWKQSLDGEWQCISSMQEGQAPQQAGMPQAMQPVS